MPAHRLPHDLGLAQMVNNQKLLRMDGQTLPMFRFTTGAPTGAPDAKFAFDVTNGKLYGNQSSAWVEIGLPSTADFATDSLKVNSVPVAPMHHVRIPLWSSGAGASEAVSNPAFFCDRAYTIAFGRVWTIQPTGGAVFGLTKTQNGIAINSGTALHAGDIATTGFSANSLNSITFTVTSLSAGDVVGVSLSGGSRGQATGTGSSWLFLGLQPA